MKQAFIFTFFLSSLNSFAQQSYNQSDNVHNLELTISDSITNLIVQAGYELQTARKYYFMGMGASIIGGGLVIVSTMMPSGYSSYSNRNSTIRYAGYFIGISGTALLISSHNQIGKAGILLSEYGLGLSIPITNK